MLKLDGVHKKFKSALVAEKISVDLGPCTYGLLGRNGSGKTTFIKLMCRLYDVTDGEILINGENIQAYTKESIINLYSVVFQDFKIFSVSLKDNICASTALDTDRLYTCLENANIKERVERLPNKENTYLYQDLVQI